MSSRPWLLVGGWCAGEVVELPAGASAYEVLRPLVPLSILMRRPAEGVTQIALERGLYAVRDEQGARDGVLHWQEAAR